MYEAIQQVYDACTLTIVLQIVSIAIEIIIAALLIFLVLK